MCFLDISQNLGIDNILLDWIVKVSWMLTQMKLARQSKIIYLNNSLLPMNVNSERGFSCLKADWKSCTGM